MTGAILGGASVAQAAHLQMVIMFMISASAALSAILVTVSSLLVLLDRDSRVRPERVHDHAHLVWRGRDWVVGKTVEVSKAGWEKVRDVVGSARGSKGQARGGGEEHEMLMAEGQ